MELELLSSRINLNHTCLKLQVSIDDIKTKHQNRTTLEKEFRTARQINFDLQHINLELKQEVKDLKKIIEFNNPEL
jgi:hypothetical protein